MPWALEQQLGKLDLELKGMPLWLMPRINFNGLLWVNLYFSYLGYSICYWSISRGYCDLIGVNCCSWRLLTLVSYTKYTSEGVPLASSSSAGYTAFPPPLSFMLVGKLEPLLIQLRDPLKKRVQLRLSLLLVGRDPPMRLEYLGEVVVNKLELMRMLGHEGMLRTLLLLSKLLDQCSPRFFRINVVYGHYLPF